VSHGSGGDDRTRTSFVRGLTLGALLGAAVAGSSLWSRRRRARQKAAGDEVLRLDAGSDQPLIPAGAGVPNEPAVTSEPDAPAETPAG
jgi:hypothetical protein